MMMILIMVVVMMMVVIFAVANVFHGEEPVQQDLRIGHDRFASLQLLDMAGQESVFRALA